MSYVDIILFGYIINIISFFAIFIFAIVVQLIGIATVKDYEKIVLLNKKIIDKTNILRKYIKSYKKYWILFTFFMPYSYSLHFLNLVHNTFKSGVFGINNIVLKNNKYILDLLMKENPDIFKK